MIQSILGIGASLAAPSIMKRLKDQKVQVLHAMPGRVRLQCNHWKNHTIAEELEEQFSYFPIVQSVRASGITGSLLLEFTTPYLTSEQFDEIVQAAVNISTDAYRYTEAAMKASMRNGLSSVDHLVKKQTGGKADIDSLLTLFLLMKGTTGFAANPAFASSLLFWAYTLMTKESGER
ncbi:HMA2 domain-containing protein [Pontibacillus salicampi]|uniref:HMA2 domain-containing protein n=1 Tax=Pontibacillus salicampi TaxID=1449801 RepID=A0ABV6LQF6_9BACI